METPFKTPNCPTGSNVCVKGTSWPSSCGNGVVNAEEPCDGHVACNANCMGYDTANWVCTSTRNQATQCTKCGNGKLDTPEACDTKLDDINGCNTDCTLKSGFTINVADNKTKTTCGDFIKVGSEVCDVKNSKNENCCSSDCTAFLSATFNTPG